MRYVSIDTETTGLDREKCQLLEIGLVIEDCANVKPIEELPKLKIVIERDMVMGQPYAINMNARIFKMLAQVQDIKDKEERDKFKRDNGIMTEHRAVNAIWEFLYLHGFGNWYSVRVDSEIGPYCKICGHAFEQYPDAVADHLRDVHHTTMEKTYGEIKTVDSYAEAMKLAGGDLTKLCVPPLSSKKYQMKVNVVGKNFATFDKLFLENMPGFTDVIRFRQRILDPTVPYTDFIGDDEAPNMDKCFERLGIKHITAHDSIEDAIDVIRLLRPLYSAQDTFLNRVYAMQASMNAPRRT